MLEPLPEAVEVGEADGLPEPTEPPVTDPAADGQHPPQHHDRGHAVNPLVVAPGRHSKKEEVEDCVARKGGFKEGWLLSANANATGQNAGSFFWRVFIRAGEA